MPTDVLRAAQQALEAGDSAREIARTYVRRADNADVLPELVSLMRQYDGEAGDGLVLDHVLKGPRDGPGSLGGGWSSEEGPSVVSLTDVLADPKALAPPQVVVPRFAWRGRSSLLAAREKLGKSTTARAGCAAVSTGRSFLGAATTSGRVLYVALEEHMSDVARGFQEFRADSDQVFILDRVGEPFTDLEAAVRKVEPVLVVVDTLAAFVESLGLDPGSSSDWTPVMSRLAHLCRDEDVALQLLHHGTKRDGKYRDSTAIGAGVDAILEMSEGMEGSLRRVRARSRWHRQEFSLRMVNGMERPRFELSSGDLSLDARVLMYLERHPGTSTRAVRENVEGKTTDVTATLHRLEREGVVENQGAGNRHKWSPVENPGTGLGTGSGSRQITEGTGPEPVLGTEAVPESQPIEPHARNHTASEGKDKLQSNFGSFLDEGGK